MEKTGLSIAAMVLGIISCVLSCIIYVSIPCGILAIVFGAIELKKYKSKMAKAGFITGIIGIAIPVVIILFSFILGILGIVSFAGFITSLVV